VTWEECRQQVSNLPKQMCQLAQLLGEYWWIGDMHLMDVLKHEEALCNLKKGVARYEEALKTRGKHLRQMGSEEEGEPKPPEQPHPDYPRQTTPSVCEFVECNVRGKWDEIEEMSRDGDSRVIEANPDAPYRRENAE
jgi:hypothetical protein